MANKYYYRVKLSSGVITSNPSWSKKDALAFARFALKAGAMGACVERSHSYNRGLNRGEWDSVQCVRKRKRKSR